MKLQNFAFGKWTPGTGKEEALLDAVTGDVVAMLRTDGPDYAGMMQYARGERKQGIAQNDLS